MWARGPDEAHFPIGSVAQLLALFRLQLRGEPDLALLSIVVGAVENSLTAPRAPPASAGFPQLSYAEVRRLYDKFVSGLAAALSEPPPPPASRALVKRVSDVIWNSLTRSYYKDKAHLQSLYSYLTGRKLDCFGVAFAVVAACQVLGYSDVHLALSEDHAWVVFGPDGTETAEVTWHGKGNEDKRGQPIGTGVNSASWLYVDGYPVTCTRHMEVAALVSSINPSLTSTTDVYEVALMQQHLLWYLYDQGYLKDYPMALGNLGELEEVTQFNDGKVRPNSSELYMEAIDCARKKYANRHVYPYTFQGGYFFRKKKYKEAFSSWADAGDVIRAYNYSRDDEEIYKEFLEIANEYIPQIMKSESSGHSARSILKDPQCFAHLLRFYDGICKWEEGSQTPILHIGWAKPLVNTISKFDADVRAQVNIDCHEELFDNVIEATTNYTKEDMKKRNLSTDDASDKSQQSSNDDKKDDSSASTVQGENVPETKPIKPEDEVRELGEEMEAVINSHPTTILYSRKMIGLKNLLLSVKLNTNAISLHLTAQSQVFISKKSKPNETSDQNVHCSIRPKRVRRD